MRILIDESLPIALAAELTGMKSRRFARSDGWVCETAYCFALLLTQGSRSLSLLTRLCNISRILSRLALRQCFSRAFGIACRICVPSSLASYKVFKTYVRANVIAGLR